MAITIISTSSMPAPARTCLMGHEAALISGDPFSCSGCECHFDRDADRVVCACGSWCMQCLLHNQHRRTRRVANASPLRTHCEIPFRENVLRIDVCPDCGNDAVVAIFPTKCRRCQRNFEPLCGFQCIECMGRNHAFALCSGCALKSEDEFLESHTTAGRFMTPMSGSETDRLAFDRAMVEGIDRQQMANMEEEFFNQLHSLGERLRMLSGAFQERELAQPDCNPAEDFVTVEVPDLKCIEGHPLRSGHYGRLSWSCDSCGEGYGPRSIALQCRTCQYDVCLDCIVKDFAVRCPYHHKMAPNRTDGTQYCCQCCSEFGLWQGFVCKECQKHQCENAIEDSRGIYLCVACGLMNHNDGGIAAIIHSDAPSQAASSGFVKCSIDDVCSVCLGMCNDPTRQSVQLSCPGKHIFHEECIALWLKEHHTCPVCRVDTAGRKR